MKAVQHISPDLAIAVEYPPPAPDFDLTNHGSIWMLMPLTLEASEWCERYLPEDAPMLGMGYAIEARFVGDIVRGIAGDGLVIQ